MTFEAKLAFIAFFLLCWCVLGLIPWAAGAVLVRGRGALIALPLALVAACAGGVIVPLLGQRDISGYLLSLATAVLGGLIGCAGGIAFSRKLAAMRPSTPKPSVPHPIGAQRPPGPPAEAPETQTTNR